jgi:methylated-DNA-[protein]-cysteine S-methyltransferase
MTIALHRDMMARRKELSCIFVNTAEKTPIGTIWVAAGQQGVVAVQIGGTEGVFYWGLVARFGVSASPRQARLEISEQIEAYLQGKRKFFDVAINWDVLSPFQRKVLGAVSNIPYGERRSYGQIAAQLGIPGAPRAVGRANATNPMPLLIPCHRLVGADGSLCGYGSGEGIPTKRWLLALEASPIEHTLEWFESTAAQSQPNGRILLDRI